MTELLTAAQMRAIEMAAMDRGEVTGLVLMERAGRGVVDAVFSKWPELRDGHQHHAVVLCGPGNNGGDGYVIARLLREAGWDVAVYAYGDPTKLPEDARANHDRVGVTVKPLDDTAPWVDDRQAFHDVDLIVDALFGTGLTRAIDPEAEAIVTLERYFPGDTLKRPRIVAVDIPSGLCADSGRVLSPAQNLSSQITRDSDKLPTFAFVADLTVTFHSAKRGHYLLPGAGYCGDLRVVDIGLDRDTGVLRQLDVSTETLHLVAPPDPARLRKRVSAPLDHAARHKYSHGHVIVVAGRQGGAARLAARAALRIGAGAVTVVCPSGSEAEHRTSLDAIMVATADDGDDLRDLIDARNARTIVIGPGLGFDNRAKGCLQAVLSIPHNARSAVLDADALTLLSRNASLRQQIGPGCVLTPHTGEFARLFPEIAERLDKDVAEGPAYSTADALNEAVWEQSYTLLLKGPATLIRQGGKDAHLNAALYEDAAPWLATAGSGDVLSGIIGGLLARGWGKKDAAGTGAWLHAAAARTFGPGLIAEDLPEMLPRVLRDLGV